MRIERHKDVKCLACVWHIVKCLIILNDCDEGEIQAWVGQGVLFLALSVPSSRRKREPKQRALGLSPVGCELEVSSDPTALGPEQER